MDVRFWLFGRWILVVLTSDFGCLDVGFCWENVRFWLCGRWILVVLTLEFLLDGREILIWVDVGFWLCDVGFRSGGCWILLV